MKMGRNYAALVVVCSSDGEAGEFLGHRHPLPPLRHLCFLGDVCHTSGRQADLPKKVSSNIEPRIFALGDLGAGRKKNGLEGTFGWLQAPATRYWASSYPTLVHSA